MTDAFVGHFDACLGCMACVTACPSGVEYAPLVEATRAQIERRFERSFGDRLFRSALFAVIPIPARLRLALAPLVVYGWIRPLIERSGLLNLLPGRVRALAKLAPSITLKSLAASTAEVTPAVGARRMRVGLLDRLRAAARVRTRQRGDGPRAHGEGCEVVAPRSQGCCGALALHAGREQDARAFAHAGDRGVRPGRRRTDRCQCCGLRFVDEGMRAPLRRRRRVVGPCAGFSARVRDVNELLIELGEPRATRHPLNLRVAYHDACHLAHAQGVRQQPRDLLNQIPGIELLPFAEQELCCGSAGIYNLVQPAPARQLGERKVRNIAEVRPDRRDGQPWMHAADRVNRGGDGSAADGHASD